MPSAARVSAGVDVTEAESPGTRTIRPRSRRWAKVAPAEVTATSQVRPAPSLPSTGAVCGGPRPGPPHPLGRAPSALPGEAPGEEGSGRGRAGQDRAMGARLRECGARRGGGGADAAEGVAPAAGRPCHDASVAGGRGHPRAPTPINAECRRRDRGEVAAPPDHPGRSTGASHAQGAGGVDARGPRLAQAVGHRHDRAVRAEQRRGCDVVEVQVAERPDRERCGCRSHRAARGCTPRRSPCPGRSRSPRRRDRPGRRRSAPRRRSPGPSRRGSRARGQRRPSSSRRPSGHRGSRWRSRPSGCAPGGATPRSSCSCAGRSPTGRRWSH